MGLGSLRRWWAQLGGTPKAAGRAGTHASRPLHRGGVDELAELANTFRSTVHRLASLHAEADAAHAGALRAEADKREFYAGVIRAVTQGKLDLVDDGPVPTLGDCLAEVPVRDSKGYAAAREAITRAAEEAGMADERADDLLIASGEAITNAFKHADYGICVVFRTGDSVLVRVTDSGTGIPTANLPNVILMEGFSTKVSLGMGYSLMLRLSDHLWLSTSPAGTVVQLEKKIDEPLPTSLIPSMSQGSAGITKGGAAAFHGALAGSEAGRP